MPTQTFWNLPEEKRQALIDICLDEFANNEYANASISRIVAQAGIAKGSIYQYFADKQELFLYLLDLSNQKRLDYLRNEGLPAADIGFFALLRWQMSASTRAALAYPQLTRLFYRAMAGNLPFHDEVITRMKATANEHLQQFVAHGIARGEIDANIDPQLAAVALNAIFAELGPFIMARLGLDPRQPRVDDLSRFSTPEVERIFDDVVGMLEYGLRRHRDTSS